MMTAYLLTFCLTLWTTLFPKVPLDPHRQREMVMITRDIASTDATPAEALVLENIVAYESGWQRGAVGPAGELGPFQIMPFPTTTRAERKEWSRRGAKEALRRMRVAGMLAYVGCAVRTEKCSAMIERRTWPATLYLWAHDPPKENGDGREVDSKGNQAPRSPAEATSREGGQAHPEG